jgi:sugar phosphate isomerase/epimerase
MADVPIALQLYTIRELTALDLRGALQKVAALGYEGVEIAGTGGRSADDMKGLLDSCSLRPAGNHVGLDQLETDIEAVADYNLTLGCPYVVVPYLADDRRTSAADWQRVAASLTEAAERLQPHGLKLAYHNHSFEFARFDGRAGLDILYSEAPADKVYAEVDTYWVQHGGRDPAEFIASMPGRCPLIHLKDMAAGEGQEFCEVGHGILDWERIFRACEVGGAEWYIVEQDSCPADPLESARKSIDWLRSR